jgi:hypothetical protein
MLILQHVLMALKSNLQGALLCTYLWTYVSQNCPCVEPPGEGLPLLFHQYKLLNDDWDSIAMVMSWLKSFCTATTQMSAMRVPSKL